MFACKKESSLNEFKVVHCLRGRELFARFGKMESVPSTSDGQVIPMNMNKLDSLEYLAKYDAYQAERERAGTDAESNGKNTDSASE